jgi:hypothetical protein
MKKIDKTHIGIVNNPTDIDVIKLNKFDSESKNHSIEKIGMILRKNMGNMKKLK